MAPRSSLAPDHKPPGAVAGLKSTRTLSTLRSSTHGHTPQKPPPRASTLVRSHHVLSARARPSAGPPAFLHRCSTAPLLLSRRRQPRGFSEQSTPGSRPPAPSDMIIGG
ncbi:hypothetical protein NDU88_004110 [Pleurodeles waltl]|uniref:Uncharacterized protein n=1 Tax=Pleurodeles waltl TaxID=8319 RepID=A0AAV7TT17_PLEWA|nr:hypothetical protein NDU88_004110 [Pleurodeles waltl]